MSSYYDDDDELDIHIHRGREASPVYRDHHRYQPPPPPPPPMALGRPVYYTHGSNYLVAEPSAPMRRSRSTSHRGSPERAAPAPVIITNKIYNDYDDEEDEGGRYLQLSRHHHHHGRERSRSRSRSFVSPRSSRESYELEQTRKELEAFKLQVEREKEEKRIKKEMELKRLRLEKEAEEERERVKKETEAAIEKFKIEEAEKAAKEKKEKEEREKEYQARIREDLRNKGGMTDQEIEDLLKKDKKAAAVGTSRPTYTKMSRRHLSIETLNRYHVDYEFDVDPDYVLIKRWVPEHEQDIFWAHTRHIRERRQPVLLAIEGTKKHGETEFEFVRTKKKHHDRKPSPSPLVTFLAGGRPR